MDPSSADRSTDRPAPGTDGEDLLLRLTREHRDAAGLVLALQRWRADGAGDPAGTARELVTDLVQHAADEREHLLPLVRRHLPEGDAIAGRIVAGHGRIEEQVLPLEHLSGDGDVRPRLEAVDALVARHAEDLERHVFPALDAACPAEELREAGVRAARTTRSARAAPTLSYPSREGTGTPGPGLVDRIRDLFRS